MGLIETQEFSAVPVHNSFCAFHKVDAYYLKK